MKRILLTLAVLVFAGRITAINLDDRALTVQQPDGRDIALVFTPLTEGASLEDLKAGDAVRGEYLDFGEGGKPMVKEIEKVK